MAIILGVDIGGVIIDREKPLEWLKWQLWPGNAFLRTPAVENAFDCLRELLEDRVVQEIFLISKANPETERKTRLWLKNYLSAEKANFWEHTGILPENLFFCDRNKDKAMLCRGLGVTHFVDDKTEVLKKLPPRIVKILFQQGDCWTLKGVKRKKASGWPDVITLF